MAHVPPPSSDPKETDKKMRERVDKLVAQAPSESSGSITLGGKALDYSVSAAFLPVVAAGLDGVLAEPEAAVMATSYVRKGADASTRPVCFAFNGGPVACDLAPSRALGPKHVVTPNDASMPTAPYAVADNPHSWLNISTWSSSIRRIPGGRPRRVSTRARRCPVDGDVAALTDVAGMADAAQALGRPSTWPRATARRAARHSPTSAAPESRRSDPDSCAMDLQSIVFALRTICRIRFSCPRSPTSRNITGC
jgi:hypothetical protein